MKTKILLLCAITFGSCASFAQYTTGLVSLGSSGMSIKIDTNPTQVTVYLEGPVNKYFGIGFGPGGGMQNGKDGLIYNSNSNLDYTFLGQGVTPSADAVQDWTISSQSTVGSTKKITMVRSLNGGAGDYAFSNSTTTIPISYAIGNSLSLGYHANRGSTTLNSTLGIEDIEAVQQFVIYPNPTNDFIEISNVDKIESFTIYDMNGKQIKKPLEIKEKLDVNELTPGIYFLEIKNEIGETTYHKFIKE